MEKVQFFFYNNLLDINLLNKISKNTKIIQSYILVEYYKKDNNILIINNEESFNKEILKGILVIFDISLSEILKKLNEINEIKSKNKKMYKLDTINVNIYKDDITKAYIIY